MTLKSWKDEFYPKEAHETSKEEAVDHCLNKWKVFGRRISRSMDSSHQ